MSREFDDLVDSDGLDAAERQRLRDVHELLVQAGPPPELTLALERPPEPAERRQAAAPTPFWRRRSVAVALVAAVVALACFGGGYALGNRDAGGGDVVRVVPMEGIDRAAQGSVSLGQVEPGGNWPIELQVKGLPKQSSDRGYYELFVSRDGKPGYPCGGFKVTRGTTTVRFSVPYELKDDTHLLVTSIEPGKTHWPGEIVMTTT